jgi:hypothetical protein
MMPAVQPEEQQEWVKDDTPVPVTKTGIDAILDERGSRYGKFTTHAQVTQRLKDVMASHPGWYRLSDSQKEALEMIVHKVGRILNGDPNYVDSWDDIAGYTLLIVKELRGEIV